MTIDVDTAVDDAHRTVRQLELAVTRRLDGLLQGDFPGITPGPGSEANNGSEYQPGDDVRRIDWNLTARSNSIQVRDTVADRELETWVVIDGSASLDFGTDQWQKRNLAIAAAASFGFMSCMSGSRFGAIVATPDGISMYPATGGRDNVRRLLFDLQRRDPAGQGVPDLAAAIDRVSRIGRRPGVVVLISDLIDDGDWVRPMRALSTRSRTIVAEVRDIREDELPAVGLLTLVDPETGALREVHTDNAALRARFATAATERRTRSRRRANSAGAAHLPLDTDRDWLTAIARHHLTTRRHR